jgi:hypothetical protein
MPLLHTKPFRSFFPSFSRFGVSCPALSVVQSFLTTFSLCHATVARLVVLLPVTVNVFRDPQFPRITVLLKARLLRHATVAWRGIFLQAAAKCFPDPQSLRVSSFGPPHRPAAGFLALRRFFRHKAKTLLNR